jgi:hypothetical protein
MAKYTIRLITFWHTEDDNQVYLMSDLLEGLTDLDQYLVAAKLRERLSVSKRLAQSLICRDLISGN